jgi:hypothetical protein
MDRDGHNDAVFFVGPEVEHTKAFSMKTLFVVSYRNKEHILDVANEHGCKHVYLGANKSFQKNKKFVEITEFLIANRIMVTLDYPISAHEWILENWPAGLLNNKDFIAMISVELPGVETFSKNACVKIDDTGLDQSNSGVWTLPVNELMDSNRFTPWSEYVNDEVVWTEEDNKKFWNDKRNNDYRKK